MVGIHPLFIYIACSIKIKIYLKHWQWVLFSSSCFSVCLISIFKYHSTLVCPFIFSYLPHSISWNISVTYIYSCINMTNKKNPGKKPDTLHSVKNSMTTVVVLEWAKLIQCWFSPISSYGCSIWFIWQSPLSKKGDKRLIFGTGLLQPQFVQKPN